MNHKLVHITKVDDIPLEYRNTPIGLLLEYQNLNREFDSFNDAQLLVGMCMDNRKHLHIPENFAYIIRTGGANLRYSQFKVSYAISVGGVRHIALIAHNNCGMVNLMAKKQDFITGLVDGAGWTKDAAEDHFMNLVLMHEIGNEIDFILSEASRLKKRYPKIMVAPLYYQLETNQLSCIEPL